MDYSGRELKIFRAFGMAYRGISIGIRLVCGSDNNSVVSVRHRFGLWVLGFYLICFSNI